VYWPFWNAGGSETTQLDKSPIYEAWIADLEKKRRTFDA